MRVWRPGVEHSLGLVGVEDERLVRVLQICHTVSYAIAVPFYANDVV